MIARGELTVVGTGIRCGSDLGAAARRAILDADEVFFLAPGPLERSVFLALRPDATSLAGLYGAGVDREVTYAAMVERVLERVRAGARVCFAVPGHPGVYAQPTHDAVRRARAEGLAAMMLPALSAADHLYADLGVDPGESGSYSFDATDFVAYGRRADPSVALVLWQISVIGDLQNPVEVNRRGLAVLADILLETYPASHDVVVYEAARYALCDPVVEHCRLDALRHASVSPFATLYVPPATIAELVPERLVRLGLLSELPSSA
jgi:uncharacterized protein YabN with tetrapyrrole methylase and pyrophosphatase domain